MAALLICSGWPGARHRLSLTAANVPGVDRVQTAATVEEVRIRLRTSAPDVVLLDARLPGGRPSTVRLLVAEHPTARIFVLGAHDDEVALAVAVESGAAGFLHLDLSREELVAAFAHVLSAGLAGKDRFGDDAAPTSPALTTREWQVLRGMSTGKSNGEIGRSLFLSEDTVKTHARRLFRKLGVNDRAHAVACGFRMGLVS